MLKPKGSGRGRQDWSPRSMQGLDIDWSDLCCNRGHCESSHSMGDRLTRALRVWWQWSDGGRESNSRERIVGSGR